MYGSYGWTAGAALALLLAGCGGSSSGGGSTTAAPVASTSPVTSASPAPSPAPTRQAPANLHTGPELVLDASGQGGFFDLPWPSNARRRTSGAPDMTGYPNPKGQGFVDAIYALADETSGFSPTGTTYLRFDGAVNAPADDPLQSLQPGYPVLLVDVDPASPDYLERQPIHVAVTDQADSFRPAHLLQVLPVPGRGLRPNGAYAVVVLRALGGPSDPWLGQADALTELLAGQEPAAALGPALARAMAPLPRALRGLGLHPDDVAAATVFTTGDPTASLIRQVDWAASQPPLQPAGPVAQRDVYADYTALAGEYAPPLYQTGAPPYLLSGGRQVTDANGLPVAQGTARAPFQLSIPKGPMPATGFPLYFYVHGTGGRASQAIDRGRWPAPGVEPAKGSGLAADVAPAGWATACAAGPMSPDRIGIAAADGYAAYNVFNPVAMRDNFVQMVLELVRFRALLLDLELDPALCPGTDASAAPNGRVFFDPDEVVVGGQSLGSYLSGMLAATLDGWQGAILTGAGGSWVEFAFGPKHPIDLQLVLELIVLRPGEELDRFHPIVTAFDLGVGRADNTHYLRHVLREPLPGHDPPHVLVIEGHRDLQVPTNLQRALVLALGVDLVGPDVGQTPAERLQPVLPWGGLQELSYPASANVLLPSGQRRTGVVARYLEDGIREGHHVAFQLDDPRRQIVEFCEALDRGRTPVVR